MVSRRRTVGFGTAAEAFVLVSGLIPLVTVPSAHAEVFDDMVDAPLPPPMAATADVQVAFDPIHADIEAWIGSDLGRQIDGLINAVAGSMVIGDGAAGTAEHPNGYAGGWLFGDGGAGWSSTDTGVAGGHGGAAGLFGDGGNGGHGGHGAAGGDGGHGGWLVGDGGNGGAAGDGAVGLPALGGAGGQGGLLGNHGGVGHYGTPAGGTPTPVPGFGTTDGWLTDSTGRVVVLHGLNQVVIVPPYEPAADGFGADDAAFLEANGFNAVRLGVLWAGVEPEPGVIDYAYLDSIKQTVQTLAEHHIRTLLDMHQDVYSSQFEVGDGAPAWAVQTGGLPNLADLGSLLKYIANPAQNHAWDAFWSNAEAPDGVGLENHYARMFQAVADYFGGNPDLKNDIVGYEIMNEPVPGSAWLATVLGSPAFDAQSLTPFYNQVDSAIRSVDPTTPVYFEPNVFFDEGLPTHLGTVNDPNTVFSFHDYCLTSALFGSNLGCGMWDNFVMNQAQGYAKSHGIPAFITEFGSTDNLKTITDTMRAADANRLGWLEWAYTTTTSRNVSLVYDPSQPPVGANVDAAKLATLAAPYPQLVSGTPDSWSFDNGTFRFSYSTAMADGQGHFAGGAQTTIAVPSLSYPNGYQVGVTGGHVVSAPDATELVVVSDSGANTVNVTVNPAAAGAGG